MLRHKDSRMDSLGGTRPAGKQTPESRHSRSEGRSLCFASSPAAVWLHISCPGPRDSSPPLRSALKKHRQWHSQEYIEKREKALQ